jgi:hypothetical protein
MPRRFRYMFGFGILALVPAVHGAGKALPTKIDFGIDFRCNVQCGPQAFVPRAPWYTYFPVDPNLIARAPGTTAYPPWPATFPPASQPQPAAPLPAPRGPVAPLSYQSPAWSWPAPTSTGNHVQAAGYVPAQAPSYWYSR